MTASPPERRAGRGRPRKVPARNGADGDQRAEIVAAATRLFARRGIAATTMLQIAEASGLGQSSLYYWFGSKQQILEVIVTDVNRAPLEVATRLLEQTGPVAVRLYQFVCFDVKALCAMPFDINEVHRLAGEDDTAFARYWHERQQLNDCVEQLLALGIAAGELRAVDARLAALTVLANDEAAQNWFRPVGVHRLVARSDQALGDFEPQEIAVFLADLVVGGLLADPASLDRVRALATEIEAPPAPHR